MACAAKPSLLNPTRVNSSHERLSRRPKLIPSPSILPFFNNNNSSSSTSGNNSSLLKQRELSGHRHSAALVKASPGSDDLVSANENDPEDGVSLGTLKLPGNIDIQRFETLLFQWGNSLFQGANLPLPVPLKVDKIAGGARLGFITIGDGKTDVPVYIDCLVFPASESSGPIFRAIRNGRMKDKPAPGEPRIMQSLLGALQKCVQIARL